MSYKEMAVVNKLSEAISQPKKTETSSYDTSARIERIEDGIAWVHIEGGVLETPVALTIDAKVGDTVQVLVSNGHASIIGNRTAPPTDDTTAKRAYNVANESLDSALLAKNAAEDAQTSAKTAREAADAAEIDASSAKESATNASEYAARALGNLSSVQSVAETLNWITAHGTMTNTQSLVPPETALNPSHVYFVVDANGDYEVGGTRYSVVTEPDVADIASYYVLSIDESLNNYVATHLAVDSEGLWIVPDSGGNKVLIATGSGGSPYTTAGTYIVGKVDGVDAVLACFLENGAKIGRDNSSSINLSPSEVTGMSDDGAQFFDFAATGAQVEEYINVKYPLLKNDGVEIPIGSNEYPVIPAFETDLSIIPVGQECTFRKYSISSTGTKQTLTIEFLSSDSLQSYITKVVNVSAVGLNNYNLTTSFGQLVIFEYDAAPVTIGTTKSQSVSFTVRLSTEAGGSTTHYADVKYQFNYSRSTNKLKRVLTITTRGSSSVRSGNVKLKSYVGAGIASSMTLVYAPCSTIGNRAFEDDSGAYSTAIGADLYASGDYQVVTGKYNVQDANDTYAAIIGNGNGIAGDPQERSNAFTVDWSGNVMSQGMAGVIQMFAGSTAPTGWLICDGSAVSRTTYATLFAVIGTTYGTGDGSTTFNLPDLRGRVAVGAGTGTATDATAHALGSSGGEEKHTLKTSEMPSHAHKLYYQQDAASGTSKNRVTPNGTSGTAGTSNATQNTGDGAAHNNMQPYLSINYIIATGKTA